MPEALSRSAAHKSARPVLADGLGSGHPQFAPCHIFPTADGAFFLAVSNDYQFAELSALAGQPQWPADPRFISHQARVRHVTELTALLRRQTVEHRTEEWMAALHWVGVPCAALAPGHVGDG